MFSGILLVPTKVGESSIDNAATRKRQWTDYLGSVKEIVVGEYNVFVMSSTSFKSKSSYDNAYLCQFSPSLVIADSSIMYVIPILSNFYFIQNY